MFTEDHEEERRRRERQGAVGFFGSLDIAQRQKALESMMYRRALVVPYREIMTALQDADNRGVLFPSEVFEHVQGAFVNMRARARQEHNMEESRERWEREIRLLDAVVDGIRTGTITLESGLQVVTLRFILCSSCSEFPQGIEYYSRTGEILDLLAFFAEDDDTVCGAHIPNRGAIVLRIEQLYHYDIIKIREIVDVGGDPAEHMSLPLEIRGAFSGLFDELPDRETFDMIDRELDHAEVLPEMIFNSVDVDMVPV